MKPLRLISLLWVLLPATSPSTALAGGYFLPDRGVRAASRGGAYVVGNDDLSALWYNPAALAGQKGTRLHFDAALIDFSMRFQRYTVPEVGEKYPPVENQASPLPDPSIAVSSDFGIETWTFAAGFYGPYAALGRYPEAGPQRYSLVRYDNFGYYAEAAAAWQPVAGLRIGAGPAFLTLRFNNTQAASSFPGMFGAPEERDQDGYVQIIAQDNWIPTAVAGAWIAPGEWFSSVRGLELGFSLMPGVPVKAKGRLRVRLPEHVFYDGVTLDPSEPPVTATLKFPWIVRGGARYADPGRRFDAEIDVVWEGWSSVRTIDVATDRPTYYRNMPITGDYLVPSLEMERYFKDTVSIRIGGSYRPFEKLALRLGGYRESGASPDPYFSVASADADKWAIGFGAGYALGITEIDLGCMHVFQETKDIQVKDSKVFQPNPGNPEDATSVGGGLYESGYNVFGFSVLAKIDDLF